MAFWLKACPKCGGDLEAVDALLETYVQCVQCGLELTSVQAPALSHEGRHVKAA